MGSDSYRQRGPSIRAKDGERSVTGKGLTPLVVHHLRTKEKKKKAEGSGKVSLREKRRGTNGGSDTIYYSDP